MRTWNIPLGISTCRSATCTPHQTRWIRSPSVANAFRECGRTTIRHDTTTLGGGRYHPQGRRQVPRTLLPFAHLDAAQSASRDRALPHGRTRWASRSMRSLRASGHLLQLLPQPALSQVPDQCQGEVVVRPATRTVAGLLLPPGLQRAARAGPVDLAKQEVSIRTVVRCQCRNAAGSCGRSGSPRCRDRLPQHSAYVGTDSAATPARPLCRTGWGTVARSLAVDPLGTPLLFAGESTQPRLSGQVRGWITAGFSEEATCFFWPVPAVGQREGIRSLLAHSVSGRLGRLCQGSIWRTGARASVPGPLYPSSGHLESSPPLGGWRSRHLSLEGLRASQCVPCHDSVVGRVPAPVLAACSAQGPSRIRYFGWLAHRRRRELLPLCRRLLAVAPPPAEAKTDAAAVWQCPICGSPMHVVELLTAAQIQQEQAPQVYILDSS